MFSALEVTHSFTNKTNFAKKKKGLITTYVKEVARKWQNSMGERTRTRHIIDDMFLTECRYIDKLIR